MTINSQIIFQLCEIDLSEILPPDALSPFMDEIKKREKQRKRITKKVVISILRVVILTF